MVQALQPVLPPPPIIPVAPTILNRGQHLSNLLYIYELFDRTVTGTPTSIQVTRTIRFVFDGAHYDPVTLESHPLAPAQYEGYPGRPEIFVISKSVRRVESIPDAADMTIEYSDRVSEGDGVKVNAAGALVLVQYQENALLGDTVIDWNTWTHSTVVDKSYAGLAIPITTGYPTTYDANGRVVPLSSTDEKAFRPVVTSAGEPIKYEMERKLRVLNCSKNLVTVPPKLILEQDFINDRAIRINGVKFEALTLKVTDINIGKKQIWRGVVFYPFSFSLYHKPETWIEKIRNAGYLHRVLVQERGTNGLLRYVYRIRPIQIGNPPATPTNPILLMNFPSQLNQPGPISGQIGPPGQVYLAEDWGYNSASTVPSLNSEVAAIVGPTVTATLGGEHFPVNHGHVWPNFTEVNDAGHVGASLQVDEATLTKIYNNAAIPHRFYKLLDFKRTLPLAITNATPRPPRRPRRTTS